MRTHLVGGGGASKPSAIVAAKLTNTSVLTIPSFQFIVLNLTQFTTYPVTTDTYEYVSDAGEGGPGIQINKLGFYQVNALVACTSDSGGPVTIGFDYPPYNGNMLLDFTSGIVASASVETFIPATGFYFTIGNQSPDAMTLYVDNATGADIVIGSSGARLVVTRLGDSGN